MSGGDAWARIRARGLRGVTNLDLLAMCLSREERDVATNESAAARLARLHQGSAILDLSPAELLDAAGLEGFESGRILSAMELGRRAATASHDAVTAVTCKDDAYRLFQNLEAETQEHFCVALLNSKGFVIARPTVHIGTVNMSVVGPREVFREAVRAAAASVIVAHNHPSGDPTPSPEDISITQKLAQVGNMLDIPVLDHIIVGKGGRFTSLNDLGHV